MSKKINFYLTKTDWEKISVYLKAHNFLVLADRFPTEKPVVLSDIDGDGKNICKYLVLADQFDQVLTNYANAYKSYTIQAASSPVIELDMGVYNENQMFHGRFYYEISYFEGGCEMMKNSDFLKVAQALFAWFRRNFMKGNKDTFYGYYISKNVIDYIGSENKQIILK